MSEAKDDDPFLARWSRRKVAAREGEPLPEPKPAEPPRAAAEPAVAPQAPAAVELPPLESLDGLKSDYEAFMRPGVDEGMKRAAIKKLFTDPHFNAMDGLDVYIDDYTQFEPLAPGMLEQIAAVKHLFPKREDERPEGDAESATQTASAHSEEIAAAPCPATATDGDGGGALREADATIRPDAANSEPARHVEGDSGRNGTDS
ncbi:MAG: DUF3306 domain-containing protein [Burkholderiales bacterium]|nr:DUF3306 domain-containing protein [Burkholderiales bacterium]